MITFKSVADLSKLSREDPSRAVIHNILTDFPRDPDIHGYIVLIEPGDTHIDLRELKGTIAAMSWEGVWKQDGHYIACYLTSNEFGIDFIIPDADWLNADLRASLEEQAQKGPPYLKSIPF